MSEKFDLKDLFLSDEILIELAMRELRGKRPPQTQAKSVVPQMTAFQARSKLQRELDGRSWTYRDLANAVGITAAEAGAIARGGQRLNSELAEKLARVFATSVDYWLRDGE